MSKEIVPFLACGDLCGYDSDRTYLLPKEGYVSTPPVQPPIAPPFLLAAQKEEKDQPDPKK